MRILLVEDNATLGDAVRDHLAAGGHAIDWMTDIASATGCLHAVPYDLVLLDLNLPDGSGLDMLRGMRGRGDACPVIILTALDQISDRIEGLNSGADDYLVKPFDLEELSARVNAVARRYTGNPNPFIAFADVEVDVARRIALREGRRIDLTGREWALLDHLLNRPGAIASKTQLEDCLYAFGAEVESNTVEVYVSRLRKKLGRAAIETVRGVGYRIAS